MGEADFANPVSAAVTVLTRPAGSTTTARGPGHCPSHFSSSSSLSVYLKMFRYVVLSDILVCRAEEPLLSNGYLTSCRL